ncbi:MAG: TPM domain-containing protein, partial [Planctomycetes bacterium]|nr:TPM domain-containing protein [Planctomycetota bacterium]
MKRWATRRTGRSPTAVIALAVTVCLVGVLVSLYLGGRTSRTAAAAASIDMPVPTEYVTDKAGVIDADSARRLSGYLKELEEKTGAQVLVLTVDTTGGVPIQNYTFTLAEKWGLGQKDKDNGALIVVAVKDRKYWITVGYGLEGPLPDAFVGRVARKYFVPNFRQGKFGKGLFDGTVALLAKLEQEYGVSLSGMPQVAPPPARRSPGAVSVLFNLLFPLAFIVLVIVAAIRRRAFVLFGTGGSSGWTSGGGSWGSFGGGGGS